MNNDINALKTNRCSVKSIKIEPTLITSWLDRNSKILPAKKIK